MSPTVLREAGYQFVVFPNDHAPAHVHVFKADEECVFTLDPVQLRDNPGRNNTCELGKIRRIIENNHSQLLLAWDR
ncbi:MAG: DUF4160 domain-containing protein, partial [Anaerolineae bacterium]|nr:DUF4160 domain-containing protein [Anaerolineae bacterium]